MKNEKAKIKDFLILQNERPAPNVFKNKYHCDFCDDFISQVIVIPPREEGDRSIFACSSCLDEMIKRLDKNIVDNFQKDFEESRKGDGK